MKLNGGNILNLPFFFFLVMGLISCNSSQKIELDPVSSDFYEMAQLIMAKEEKRIFNHLPDEDSRREFIKEFWLKRDPIPGTEENEYQEEFLARIEYANKYFGGEGPPGWKTDRGRIYIYLGPPDKVDEYFSDEFGNVLSGSRLIWIYYQHQLGIIFVNESGIGRYKLDPSPYEMGGGVSGSLSAAIKKSKLGLNLGRDDFQKKYVNFDVQYDNQKEEIVVSIPVRSLIFVEEGDQLRANFEFEFHIYEKDGPKKEQLKETKSFSSSEEEILELKNIVFSFPFAIEPGRYYFDVIIFSEESLGKARKIFEIKV